MTIPSGVDVTDTSPPDLDDDDEEDRARIEVEVSFVTSDTELVTATASGSVNLPGPDCDSPERFARALLRAAEGCAAALGPDYHWALRQQIDMRTAGQQ